METDVENLKQTSQQQAQEASLREEELKRNIQELEKARMGL